MLVASVAQAREALTKRLSRARAETDRLFECVQPGSLFDRPIPERHRLVFYLGHLEAFDWNLLISRLPGIESFDPVLDRLFAFGIDPIDGTLPQDQPSDWPGPASIAEYSSRVRNAIDEALARSRWQEWRGDETPELLLNVAIEHRLMHAETLSYMLHQLPVDSLAGAIQPSVPGGAPRQSELVHIPVGRAILGRNRADSQFGWDNEYDEHAVAVDEFSIGRYKVTNAEFLEFVRAGGYRSRELWTEAGWTWKEAAGIEHPLCWRREGERWRYRASFDEIPFPQDWPVYASHAEARAYALWRGKRLPTEAEWHRAAYGGRREGEPEYPWGEQAPDERHGYLGMSRWDPVAVNAYPDGRSDFGVEGMLCNGWEWTSTQFAPFPGFQPFASYPGYSANFFDGQHYVLKGGSPRTERCMLRRSFRNWFQPHYQYVFAGFRCVG